MNVNGSVTPVHFDYVAAETIHLTRLNISLTDGNIQYGKFGGLAAALTNGLLIRALDADGSGVIKDFLDGEPIKVNEHFANLAGVDAVSQPAAGLHILPVRWTFAKSGANLQLHVGQRLRITIQDDLTGISYLAAMVQGHIGTFGKGM